MIWKAPRKSMQTEWLQIYIVHHFLQVHTSKESFGPHFIMFREQIASA